MATFESVQPTSHPRRANQLGWLLKIGPVYLTLVMLIFTAAASQPSFLKEQSIRNVLVSSTPLAIAAVGQTLVILTAGIDLSIGPIISLANLTCAVWMKDHPESAVGIALLCALIGLLIGAANGYAVGYRKLNPFILTLGMGTIIRGVTLSIKDAPGGAVTRDFMQISRAVIGPIPAPVLYLLVLYLIGMYMLKKTPYGLSVFAVGGNENSARLSGIRTRRVILSVYAISGLLAACAGIFLAARIGSGDPLVGDAFTLDAVTATVLGGTSLMGGIGGLWGTLAGVLIIGILNTMLNLNNISTFYQWIVKGAILIGSLAFDFWRQRRHT